MKVLFLDIDGVLNSAQFIKALYRQTKKGSLIREFCPISVSNLIEIVQEVPDLKIVISSTWRKSRTVEQLQALFEPYGIADRVIDKTPVLYDTNGMSVPRGREIQLWLDGHPEVERFVIIDDDKDMEHLMPHLVRTKWTLGLMLDKAEEAIKHLKEG